MKPKVETITTPEITTQQTTTPTTTVPEVPFDLSFLAVLALVIVRKRWKSE